MRRLLVLGFLAALATGCNNGNAASTTPTTTATPTPVPTASPVPTATPVPPKSENYFPLSNQAAYDGPNSGGGFVNYGKGPLAISTAVGTACGAALGTFGDYQVAVGPTVVPVTDLIVNNAYRFPLITKNTAGDVYIVGYTTISGTGETCVQPYPIAKATMVKGAGWTFVDIAGVSRTAVVVSDHTTATFTPQTNSGPLPPVTYTGIVAQVAYGSDNTIYWAAGYGPVQIINTGNAGPGIPGQLYPQQLTAHDWTLDPASK
ncbi:MAG: hypothetical protein QOJ39_2530 [Candidatus Eremiobacteraeota bacterium]|nr:hypothetical protein [Candidatus Eremiobacteraeota bacterium]